MWCKNVLYILIVSPGMICFGAENGKPVSLSRQVPLLFLQHHNSCHKHKLSSPAYFNVKEAKSYIYADDGDYDSPYIMDSNWRPVGVKEGALPLQTPHSGRKFRPTHPNFPSTSTKIRSRIRSIAMPWTRFNKQTTRGKKVNRNFLSRNNRRFTEGWYYRLTIPGKLDISFMM